MIYVTKFTARSCVIQFSLLCCLPRFFLSCSVIPFSKTLCTSCLNLDGNNFHETTFLQLRTQLACVEETEKSTQRQVRSRNVHQKGKQAWRSEGKNEHKFFCCLIKSSFYLSVVCSVLFLILSQVSTHFTSHSTPCLTNCSSTDTLLPLIVIIITPRFFFCFIPVFMYFFFVSLLALDVP